MSPSRIITLSLVLVALLFAIYLPFAINKDNTIIEKSIFSMGTVVHIKVPLGPKDNRKAVDSKIEKAFGEMRRVESVFSVFKKDSEASRINRLKKDEVMKVSDEVFNLIEKSVEYSKTSDDAFDITVKPLVDLWTAAKASQKLPSEEEVRLARSSVGSQYIVLDVDDRTISFRKDGMALDFGGIAKGYATDRAVKVLKENGIANAVVISGGDVYCLGTRSAGKPWTIGIQHPRDQSQVFTELELQDAAIDTAGDYEKYFILGGRRYSHIIDPRSGYPIGNQTISATVIADDAATADMTATSLCVLGRDGLKIIDPAKNEYAMLIVKEGDKLKTFMAGKVRGRFRAGKKLR